MTCAHGMPSAASCIDCMDTVGLGPAPTEPVAVESRPFAARFAGTCWGCGTEIHQGQQIVRLSNERFAHDFPRCRP